MYGQAKQSSGIQGFSKPEPVMVMWAADAIHQPHEVRGYLTSKGIQFTPMLGSYVMGDGKRVVEFSYCTSLQDFSLIQDELCKGQESVLIMGSKDSRNRHKATLHYLVSGELVEIGRMFDVPVLDAPLWGDNWSIPLDGKRHGAIVAYVCAFTDLQGDPIQPGSLARASK